MITKGFIALTMVFSCHVFSVQLSILTEHLAPFQIVTSDAIDGLSTEIIEATLKESNYEYTIEAHQWSSSFNRAKQETNTCIYSIAYIPSREPMFQWVGHIITSSISFYSLKNNPLSISNLDDAKKYKTAVIKDDVTHHFLQSKGFVENTHFYAMNNYDALLKLLEIPSRKIDLVILNDDLINNRVNNLEEASKYRNVYALKELSFNFHFACSLKTDKKIVDKLKSVMKKLEKNGVYSAIRNKWKKKMVNMI